jgi:hypothetical protein
MWIQSTMSNYGNGKPKTNILYLYKNASKNMENNKSMPKMPIQIFMCYLLFDLFLKLLGSSITPYV